METLIPINIVIGDRTYRIKTQATDEEKIRKNTKAINEKIVEFKTNFAGKDMQDYIAMALIWYASQINSNTNPEVENQLMDLLSNIEQQIDKIL